MNANELADELENTYPFVGVMEVAATMLRQQQAEIETYKLELYDEVMLRREQQAEIEAMNLSNEEIGLLTTDPKFSHIESPLLLDFARAILRKAQEK